MIVIQTLGRNGENSPAEEMSVGNALVDLVFGHMSTYGFRALKFIREGKNIELRVHRTTTTYNELGRSYKGHHLEMAILMKALYLYSKLDNRISDLEYAYLLRSTSGFTPWDELELYRRLGQRFDRPARIALAMTGYEPDQLADTWTPDGMQVFVAGLIDEDYLLEELLELAASA